MLKEKHVSQVRLYMYVKRTFFSGTLTMANNTVHWNSLTQDLAVWVFILVFVGEIRASRPVTTGQCQYDFSLPENRLIVTCGSESPVSHDHGGKTSAKASLKFHQVPTTPGYNPDFRNISASTEEDLQIVEEAIDKLLNINKTLLLVKSQVSDHMEKLHNGSTWFSHTENKIQNLLAHIHRRNGKSAPSYRALAATLQNQYNYVRKGVQAQNIGLTESMTALMTMLMVEEEMVSSCFALAEVFSRRFKELSSLLAILKGGQTHSQQNSKPKTEPSPTNKSDYEGDDSAHEDSNKDEDSSPDTDEDSSPDTDEDSSPDTDEDSSPDKEEDKSQENYQLGYEDETISEQCRQLYGIGTAEAWVQQRTTQGTVMVDSKDQFGYIWIMYGYGGTNKIVEFESILALENKAPKNTITLPFHCEGTGQVVFDGSLYCLKAKTNHIVRFELKEKSLLMDVPLAGAGVYNTYPYQFGGLSDVDFAVDERGLWVIYATKKSAGKIVISQLDPISLSLKRSWVTDIEKKMIGNTFMVCGVLYAVDSFSASPTFIKYDYDTNTDNGRVMESSEIPFMNGVDMSRSFTVMVDYEPRDQKIYTWNNGKVEIYPVLF